MVGLFGRLVLGDALIGYEAEGEHFHLTMASYDHLGNGAHTFITNGDSSLMLLSMLLLSELLDSS